MHLSSWLHRSQLSGKVKSLFVRGLCVCGDFMLCVHLQSLLIVLFFCLSFRTLYAGVIRPRVKTEDRVGSREPRTPASARLDGRVSIVTSPACLVTSQPSSKVKQPNKCYFPLCNVFFMLLMNHNFFLYDFRGRRGSPVQKLRPVSGCRKHSLLSMPGWLHWELLPRTSGRMLTQSLPEWSCLY